MNALPPAPKSSHSLAEPLSARMREVVVMSGPLWSLRVEGRKLSVVLQRASLPGGAEIGELSVALPHVAFPFDFSAGLERFRHHRGIAEELVLRVDARVLLDWLHQESGGAISGSAQDDQLVLSGRTDTGTRWTARARLVPERPDDGAPLEGAEAEPLLVLSLYNIRVYGASPEPWPLIAGRVLSHIPGSLLVDQTLTTARLRCVRIGLAHALSGLGWKLPDVSRLVARGVELREGRFIARFSAPRAGVDDVRVVDLSLDDGGTWEGRLLPGKTLRSAFERFVEDLEVKRHHGQVDRLLSEGKVREALAEVYRALDGPPRPGFLAERLIGITASQPILHDEGERVCRALLEISPSYEPALAGLASIGLMRNRPEEAAVQLERLAAVLNGPGDREDATAVDLTLAAILADFAPEESRAALERVLVRAPDHEEALSELIALAEREGDIRVALPLYKRLLFAARSKARTREAGLRLARFALERNEPEDARVLLKVVLEASPEDLEAKVALAEVETQEGRGHEALRILEEALRGIAPTDTSRLVKVIALLATLLLDVLADPARARRVLWRAGDLSRMEAPAAIELASLALKAREPTLGLRFCDLVGPDSSEWAESQALRAEALLARNDSRGALKAVLSVLSREPDHERALAMLEQVAPEAASREWLVHQLYESAARVPTGESRARILYRVAQLYESLDLRWDALTPLSEAVYTSTQGPKFETRALHLLDLQEEFGLYDDVCRTGRALLTHMREMGLGEEQAVAARVQLLTRLGRIAMDELGDLASAKAYLEEGARLSPRSREGQELLARALSGLLEQMPPHLPEARPLAAALSSSLTRLQTLRELSEDQDEARLKLAWVQLEYLRAPGQARATLAKLAVVPRTEAVIQLFRAAGLPLPYPVEALTPKTAPPLGQPQVFSPTETFAAALGLADAGETLSAISALELLLAKAPEHKPASELLALLKDELAFTQPPLSSQATGAPPSAQVVTPRFEEALAQVASPWTAPQTPSVEVVLSQGQAPEPERAPLWSPKEWALPQDDASWEPAPWAEAPIEPRALREFSPLTDIAQEATLLEPSTPTVVDTAFVLPEPEAESEFDFEPEPELELARPPEVMTPTKTSQLAAKQAEGDAIDAILGKATEHFFDGDLEGARAALESLFELDPDVIAALELYVEVLAALGDHAKRATVLERLVDYVFDRTASTAYMKALGEAHALSGNEVASLLAYERYLRLQPLDEGLFWRSITLLEALETQEGASRAAELWEARADAFEDLDMPREQAEALAGAARSHVKAGKVEAAHYAAERALMASFSPMGEDPEMLELFVQTALASKRTTEAQEAAARLVPLLLEGATQDWAKAIAEGTRED